MHNRHMKQKQCSFCGQFASKKRKIIQGPHAAICEECIKFSHQFLESTSSEEKDFEISQLQSPPLPAEIKQHLDKFIVGQEQTKKILAVAAYNHYKRVWLNQNTKKNMANGTHNNNDPILDKSNILLIGPTGVGKTLLANTLADFLKVPFAITDATSLTEAGYVGEDVENVLLKLIKAANDNLDKAEYGIVFIDEVDKLSKKSKNVSITRDVSGEGVQHALLKIIEGTIASIPPHGGRKHPHQQNITLDTTNILFICGGAFIGLEEIIRTRSSDSEIGFVDSTRKTKTQDRTDLLEQIQPEDLINYGFVPELVGRLPIISVLSLHTIETLYRILQEPQNSIIKQFVHFFKQINIDLEFEDKALWHIAEESYTKNTGARGLRSSIEKILLETMFDVPSKNNIKKVLVTEDNIINNSHPLYIYHSSDDQESA